MKKAAGILVSPKIDDNENTFSKWNLGIFVLLFYFYLGIYGCVYGFLSAFPVECDDKLLFYGIFGIGIVYLGMYLLRKWIAVILPLAGLAYGWIVYSNFAKLREAISLILQKIGEVINSYGEINSAANVLDITSKREVTICLLMMVFILAGIFFWGIMVNGGRIIAVIGVIIVIGAALAVGIVPATLPLCMMGLFLIGTFASGGLCNINGQKMGGIIMGLIGVSLFVAGHFLLVPALAPYFVNENDIKLRIQQTSLIQELSSHIPSWQSSSAKGGIGNGEFGNAETIINTNEEALEVTADSLPVSTVYLKCYVGSIYTGKEWSQVSGSDLDQVEAVYYQLFQAAADNWDGVQMSTLEIKLKGAPEEYLYQPYFPNCKSIIPRNIFINIIIKPRSIHGIRTICCPRIMRYFHPI